MSAVQAPTNQTIIDRDMMVRRRVRQRGRQPDDAVRFLHDVSAGELADRLDVTVREFAHTLLVDDAYGAMRDRIRPLANVRGVVASAPHPQLLPAETSVVVADDEALPFAEGSLDLVLSNLSLHLTNDTPGALIQIRRALRPDGLFSAALLGGDTLSELRQSLLAAEAEITGGVSPRVVPFPDIRDLGALLQRAGFALPVTDTDRLTVRYDTMFDLMRDLRRMGLSNSLAQRSRRPATRGLFVRAAEIYADRFSDGDGRIRATFDFIYLSGWTPHESQQKPARRGSAEISLKDVLGRKS
ncbi:methyltransferase domain-containing protein [Fulvimarina sp. 2208YS6-2-32]|uniref:Methyltransferase domain-containing protein n=1 Tax=Fulvimarina uroteuthidis TaxID=3098149 RepID=A0ABU5I589_9HYPH|nr:methyltransferase domain-containing protein [Fulvimarina sp. 2208YS6-2-32]MDY8110542.1 methyltransferase domain-containing protein [Fulvimarina sp. 2208YS6-2-32]